MPWVLWTRRLNGWARENFDTETDMLDQAEREEADGYQCETTHTTPRHRDNFNNSARGVEGFGE